MISLSPTCAIYALSLPIDPSLTTFNGNSTFCASESSWICVPSILFIALTVFLSITSAVFLITSFSISLFCSRSPLLGFLTSLKSSSSTIWTAGAWMCCSIWIAALGYWNTVGGCLSPMLSSSFCKLPRAFLICWAILCSCLFEIVITGLDWSAMRAWLWVWHTRSI